MSLVLPSAVTLLAHKRLVDAVEALDRKLAAAQYDVGFARGRRPTVVNNTERRVLGLARTAKRLFEAGPGANAPHGLQVGQGIGQYALLGGIGLDLPAYADVLAPGGTWVAEVVRHGSPDPNLGKVVAGSTQFAVRAGERALDNTTVQDERERIQAFSMGLACGVAHGVVTAPVLRGLQARRTKREWTPRDPAADLGAADARVLRELLGGTASGAALFQGWWPPAADVPEALFTGYLEALEEVYALSANRPKGFRDFEDGFEAGDPLTAVRLRNAYAFLRGDAAISAWSWGGWYLALTPILIMPPVGLIVAKFLPHGRFFFSSAGTVDERAVYEVLMVGLGLGALAPFGYSMWLWSQIDEHTDAFVNALVLFVARLALAIAAYATFDEEPLIRWLLLFLPLIGTDVYALARGIRGLVKGRPGVAFVFFLNTLPAMTASTVLLFAALMKLVGVDSELAFWLLLLLFTAVLFLAVGLPVSWALSRTGGLATFFQRRHPELPILDSLASLAAADPAALALLFDDSTLWHDGGSEPPTLADLRYPSGPRALLRLWWEGDGDLEVSHDARTLVFRKGDGSTLTVTVPPGSTTAAAVAEHLRTSVAGLRVEVAGGEEDPLYDLPFPSLLSDPGDALPTLAEHDRHRGDFVEVGKSSGKAYVLRHTPRVELATGYGQEGPSRSPLAGLGLVPSGTLGDLESSALGLAADLGVLLCLGAAPSIGGPVTAAPRPGLPALPARLDPVYQVFRQWNLDERRVNEWRMLVHGGAESEKGGNPVARDPAMRPDPAGPAAPYASHLSAGEASAADDLLADMGWVPLWRAWLRMAGDLTADTAATTAMPYTPAVTRRDATVFQPTNSQLTDAVRYLLDLA